MNAAWQEIDVVRAILTVSTLVPFVLFGSAGVWHFGGQQKSGTMLVTLGSLAGLACVLYTLWAGPEIYLWSLLGVALQSFSVFVFGWCIGTSGKRNLGLAFADSASQRLVTEGPYAVVRHPFYTSYILFWIGGLAVAPSLLTLVAVAALIGLYFHAAAREDEALASHFKDEFARWQSNTGAFFPKLR